MIFYFSHLSELHTLDDDVFDSWNILLLLAEFIVSVRKLMKNAKITKYFLMKMSNLIEVARLF